MDLAAIQSGLDTIWVVLTAAMILLMEGGFALLEAGFVRQKKRRQHHHEGIRRHCFGALVFFLFRFRTHVWQRFLRLDRNDRLYHGRRSFPYSAYDYA